MMMALPFRLVRTKAEATRGERRQSGNQGEAFEEHLRDYNDEAAESIHQQRKMSGDLLSGNHSSEDERSVALNHSSAGDRGCPSNICQNNAAAAVVR